MVLRSFHSLLCKRLTKIPLRKTQKGFMERDGIAENTAILKALLRRVRNSKRGAYLCFLDVSKAFDSVSHKAIVAALERLGVPSELITYIICLYTDAKILVGDQYIVLGRGVRQGCPLSTFLFNAVIDMCLDGIEVDFGYSLSDVVSLAELFFADDGILVSETRLGCKRLLDRLTDRFRRVGLVLNARKSQSLALSYCGRSKKHFVDAALFLKVDEVEIPSMDTHSRAKYLGVIFEARDFRPFGVVEKFTTLASRVRTAPLNPAQKLHCVKSALVPKFLHQLVLSDTTDKLLRKLDILLRELVRNILKLPIDTSQAVIHATPKLGGLGIPSLWVTVKRLHFKRMLKLTRSDCPLTQFFVSEGLIRVPEEPKVWGKMVSTKSEVYDLWKESLEASVDQRTLVSREYGLCTRAWWTDPSFHLGRSGDFIKAIHVRYKTLSTPTRLRRRNQGDGRCRIDLTPDASLTHISQVCAITHGFRSKRHNELSDRLQRGLKAAGWRLIAEPHILTDHSFVKPDIVAWKECGKVVVIDPCVTGDSVEYLRNRAAEKTAKYSTQAVRDYCAGLLAENGVEMKDFKAIGVPVQYRGDILQTTVEALLGLGIQRRYIAYLSYVTVVATWHLWHTYVTNSIAGGRSAQRRGRNRRGNDQ
jgi:hypothetical protein